VTTFIPGQCCGAGGQRSSCRVLPQGCSDCERSICGLRGQQHQRRRQLLYTEPTRAAACRFHFIRAEVRRGCSAAAIVVAFAVAGALCARILNTRLKPIRVDAGYHAFMSTVGRTLQRQMLGTTGDSLPLCAQQPVKKKILSAITHDSRGLERLDEMT
jgi:hypothetical protein